MTIHFIPLQSIKIAANRQRQEFDPIALGELRDSIQNIGLLHPSSYAANSAIFIWWQESGAFGQYRTCMIWDSASGTGQYLYQEVASHILMSANCLLWLALKPSMKKMLEGWISRGKRMLVLPLRFFSSELLRPRLPTFPLPPSLTSLARSAARPSVTITRRPAKR